jgi:hypothetical protein
MQSCFVIMPVTTPNHLMPTYGDDSQHFKHVLEHLFVPAIKLAGFDVIPPIAKGAELIHAEIIKNLESSDLVLCDMSLLNPNVFFELGIRTTLNKPVCMVKDDKTERIPFDATIINHKIYNSALVPWMLDQEIQSMSTHIKTSITSHGKNNALWSYFSMSIKAQPQKETTGIEGKIDFLNVQLDGLRRQVESLNRPLKPQNQIKKVYSDPVLTGLLDMLQDYSDNLISISRDNSLNTPSFIIQTYTRLPSALIQSMNDYARSKAFILRFKYNKTKE